MSLKIIVSNRTALIAKYKPAGLARIREAVRTLIDADRERGFTTKLVFLDDAKALKSFAVTDIRSGQQHKAAVDRVYTMFKPEYLVILDGPDVVPHVSLENPAAEDGDDDVPSDLPYACDTPFTTRDPRRYLEITRVVGRIAGEGGADRPTFLTNQLKLSAAFKPRPRSDYTRYFAISAAEWRKSTHKSIEKIFKVEKPKVLLSPPVINGKAGPYLSPLMHFINCHGGDLAPEFYGQRGEYYPTALTTEAVSKNAVARTVVAAECCYGAQLYKVSDQADARRPIALSYLENGAAGFFGSTNTAYGDAKRNSAADMLTQNFLIAVLESASLGRACLQARQKFVDNEYLDNYNLKTIAQFILLGDPSLHPCIEQDVDEKKLIKMSDWAQARAVRRTDLLSLGKSAAASSTYAARASKRVGKTVARDVKEIARELGVKGGDIRSYDVSGGMLYRDAMKIQKTNFNMTVLSKATRPSKKSASGRRDIRVKAVVVHTSGGRVAHIAHYVSR